MKRLFLLLGLVCSLWLLSSVDQAGAIQYYGFCADDCSQCVLREGRCASGAGCWSVPAC